MSTTSGASARGRARPPRAPSPASPTTSMSGSALEDHAEAGAHERLVVGEQRRRIAHASHRRSGRRARNDEAAAGRGPASSSPP